MRQSSGFSLFEIVVAGFLLSTGMIPIMQWSQSNLREAGRLQETFLAQQLVMDLCERYKSSELPEIERAALEPSAVAQDELLMPLATVTTSPVRFARRVLLERDYQGHVGLHKVTFVVSWTGGDRRRKSVLLARVIHWH